MPKLFAIGVTGYIGGDAFYTIHQHHPEYEWTFLVRDPERVAPLLKQYPKIRFIQGDLDSYDLIVDEVAKADIVLNWASADHQKAAEAIRAGMKMRSSPSFFIHTSGAGILAAPDIHSGTFGTGSTEVYNDWDGVSEVTSLPEGAPHRAVDKIVLSSNAESSLIHTAIVCPPCIYGEGRGPDKTRSIQMPELIRCTLERKKGFQIGQGQNRWCTVHVRDLSSVYLRLVEEATKPGGGNATWGLEGYYFTESGEHYWGDIAKAIASEAFKLGLIPSPEIERLSVDEVEAIHPFGRYLWGTNSRHTTIRARTVLGWEPVDSLSLSVELPRMMEAEARRMKLI